MEEKRATKFTCILLAVAIVVSGCTSTTVLHTKPANADVYVKGQRLGQTPYVYSDRKIAGASTLVTFKKEGYKDYDTTIRKNKKLNAGALIAGIFFIYPLFWIKGYDEAHSYDLKEVEISTQPVAVADPAKKEIAAPAAPADGSPEAPDLPQNARVDKLLSQGKIEEAVEYAEEQEGDNQYGCFYSIAQYYLNKGDYAAAENFFNRSGKISEGNVRIAESLMRGEITDSVLVIDEKKIKTYLEKVYDSEEEIIGKMAACYEKYADESKDRIALAKKLKDMGMISMSSGGKAVNIDRTLSVSQVLAIFYLNSAINAFEKLGNVEKAQELKNESEAIFKDFRGKVRTERFTAADSSAKVLPVFSDEKKISAASPEMKLTAEDDHVLITVDSIVRTSTQPQDLVKALKANNSSLNTRPARNADYVLVYFSRSVKKDLTFTSYKQSSANVSLADQLGKNYTIILERGTNYIRTPGGGQILYNPAAPQPEGVIINYSYMMFFMPVSSTPTRLNYVYYYKNDKNDRKTNTGTLTVNLTQ